LDLSQKGATAINKKDKVGTLYDQNTNFYIGLVGDLDLSDFTNLRELNLSRNYQLGKVNISNCLNLAHLIMVSYPNEGKMKMSDLIVADNYPNFQVLLSFGTLNNDDVESKLVKVESSNFRLLFKSHENPV
jgi:hypothetical protein